MSVSSKDVRGFTTFDEFKCTYGTTVRVKESSAASSPHIWLFLNEDRSVLTETPKGEAAAHLTLEQAQQLVDALTVAISEHYQIREADSRGSNTTSPQGRKR